MIILMVHATLDVTLDGKETCVTLVGFYNKGGC